MMRNPPLGLAGVATIDSVHGPVERFLGRLDGPDAGLGPLSPLDAYLLRLVLESCPGSVAVADLACGATRGATSVVCLSSPRVARVLAGIGPGDVPARGPGLGDLLAEVAGGGGAYLPIELGGRAWPAIREALPPDDLPLFLIDPATDAVHLDRDLDAILEEYPRGLVLVLSLGKAGACETVRSLAQACRDGSPHRLWLLREAGAALHSSQMALVARRDHPFAPDLVARIEQFFATNFDFLDLAHDSCMYAIERSILDRLQEDHDRLVTNHRELGEEHGRLSKAYEKLADAYQKLPEDYEKLADAYRRLEEQYGRLADDHRRLEGERDRLADDHQDVRNQLDREYARPVAKALIVLPGRRIVRFARKHRAWLAPHGGLRDRLASRLMAAQRRLLGKAG